MEFTRELKRRFRNLPEFHERSVLRLVQVALWASSIATQPVQKRAENFDHRTAMTDAKATAFTKD